MNMYIQNTFIILLKDNTINYLTFQLAEGDTNAKFVGICRQILQIDLYRNHIIEVMNNNNNH
jgi:hypothetical protein